MEEKEKKTKESAREIFLNYIEYSTIQGLQYIFLPYQVNFDCRQSPILISVNISNMFADVVTCRGWYPGAKEIYS
jgi:hypothetical protein